MISGTIQGKVANIEAYTRRQVEPMPRRERFSIAPLGEYYRDLLEVDSWINARTASTQANSLLCAKLQEREQRIEERLAYLAKKRGISSDEMRIQILKGEAEDLSPGEIVESDDSELQD